MIQKCKICGIKDSQTLSYIINHKFPPQFIGFIVNYKKSKRYIEYEKLKKLINVEKKGINFVAVLVNPNEDILEKLKILNNFDYYQLYDVNPEQTKLIKDKYKKKIISAITINNKKDLKKYKDFEKISDIILFDGKGYEKSMGFNHSWMNELPKNLKKMLAGNIVYNDDLDKYKKITDIVDISGSLETNGHKDINKIDIFLRNIKKTNDKN
tara:strand:- start:257 stop:889 length:633 start_codon:yes stop_codon:yes gene_type:complete